MDKYYVVIAGSKETSRANVEALIEDYVYAKGNDVVFILPYEKKPSSGQTFAAQWAKDKAKDIIIFANPGANYDGLPGATVNETDSPYEATAEFLDKSVTAYAFLLWDGSNELPDIFGGYNIPCYDLTEGLNLINVNLTQTEVTPKVAAPILPQPELEPLEVLVRQMVDRYLEEKASQGGNA